MQLVSAFSRPPTIPSGTNQRDQAIDELRKCLEHNSKSSPARLDPTDAVEQFNEALRITLTENRRCARAGGRAGDSKPR